jgi:hypothetical protein
VAHLEIEWNKLKSLEGDDLKREIFSVIQKASRAIHSLAEDDPKVLETVPRLIDLLEEHPEELQGFRELIGSLARSTGLWNYIDTRYADTTDALIAEAVTSPELGGVTLHREQVRALNSLLEGKNLILSAPTSFGKSLLVDALLATDRYARVAVVLPTIALLDEFRRRFQRRFGTRFKIVMHQGDEVSDTEPVIFLGTQERLINREDLGKLDLTVVDEFYKLDPSRRDERSVTLNAAVYRLLKISKQFFFLGPNIDAVLVSNDTHWNFAFLKTRFSTVAVDTFDMKGIPNKRERLFEEIGEDNNWPALVFISSPDRANSLAIELSEKMAVSDGGAEFAEWLRENIGERGFLPSVVEYGFGIHHGRIPRAIASQMIRMFNYGELPVLMCTSTLIEGVNTAAKTVMIFDKAINRVDYDFFTFSNIRGRAGRLGEHATGRVIVFNDIPEHSELEVSPTLFGDESDYPDEYIVHMEPPERSERAVTRYDYFRRRLGLDSVGLRLASSVGLELAVELKDAVERSLQKGDELVWDGWPKYPEINALCHVACSVGGDPNSRVRSFGAYSAKQLAFLINKLRNSRTLREFLLEQDRGFKGRAEGYDSIFKFLRACEYGLPQNFACIELFVSQGCKGADYSLFLGGIANWFRPEILKQLDEEGIPIQISERFIVDDDTKQTLKHRLREIAHSDDERMSLFERRWVSETV